MAMDILESLKQGVVLGDGGYLEEAKYRGYSTPRVIVEFPDVLRQIHVDFFRAGAQVLQALTWWTSRSHLDKRGKEQGWGDRLEEINRTAVRVAKEAAAGEALVAGCVVPSFRPDVPESHEAIQAEWDEQIAVMVEAGVDMLICEAFLRLDEARLALACCKKANVPAMVWMSIFPMERVTREEEGVSPAECARVLVDEGADSVGMNCTREPRDMWSMVLEMREAVDVPIAFMPVGHRTSAFGWRPIREAMIVPGVEMAEYALKAKAEGINFIGACCGAGPEHIRAMAQALDCERDPV